MQKKFTYIDLFSGAGGFSLGFDKAGFKNVFSVDREPEFCETYKFNFPNHKLIQKDITKLTKKEILNLVNNRKVDVIIGGPPCQGFSIAGNIGRRFLNDERNYLFKEFARVVKIVNPKFIIIENVARLYNHNGGKTRNDIINEFKKIGYHVECKVINTVDYGIPQIRRRIIFMGSRITKNLPFPESKVEKYTTVKEVLEKYIRKRNWYENHIPMNHTQQMLKKMSYVKDGGSRLQIPTYLRPKSGDVRKYIRYNSNAPSICITGDMRKVFHYSQNRALTVRELATLQSFPDNFVFQGTSISQQQQVGNSVPPSMAEIIANTLVKVL